MTHVEDLFEDANPHRRVKGRRCPVIVIFGTSGGAGASTLALTMAELAANFGQMERVVLADGRTGRSDLMSWLSANDKTPNLANAAIEHNPESALCSNKEINGFRPATLNDIAFGTILSPPNSPVSADMTFEAIQDARLKVDLVIVDAGPYDSSPASVFASLASRLIMSGGWGVMVTEMNRIDVNAASECVGNLNRVSDIERDRLSFVINHLDTTYAYATNSAGNQRLGALVDRLSPRANYDGAIPRDVEHVHDVMRQGQIPTRHVVLGSVCGTILRRVTARPIFDQLALAAEVEEGLRQGSQDYSGLEQPDRGEKKKRFGLRVGAGK